MAKPHDIPIIGETIPELLKSCNEIVPSIEPELRKRFVAIRSEYMGAYGLERALDLIRGRTVAQVVVEYKPTAVVPLEKGERDGLKFTLYDSPSDKDPS